MVALFLVGVGLGATVRLATQSPPPANPFPSHPPTSEPLAAAEVAAALRADDPARLAALLDEQRLDELNEALAPIVEPTEVRHVGSVQAGDFVLSGYLVRGRDADGDRTIVGLILSVLDGAVVGVNS